MLCETPSTRLCGTRSDRNAPDRDQKSDSGSYGGDTHVFTPCCSRFPARSIKHDVREHTSALVLQHKLPVFIDYFLCPVFQMRGYRATGSRNDVRVDR